MTAIARPRSTARNVSQRRLAFAHHGPKLARNAASSAVRRRMLLCRRMQITNPIFNCHRSNSHLHPSCAPGYYCHAVEHVCKVLLPPGFNQTDDAEAPAEEPEPTTIPPGPLCAERGACSYIDTESCQCDEACLFYGDCCADYASVCQKSTTTASPTTTTTTSSSGSPDNSSTCAGRGACSYIETESCQCDDACVFYGDCCDDYASVCQTTTTTTPPPTTTTKNSTDPLLCAERGACSYMSTEVCQCDTACTFYNDCCADYMSVCHTTTTRTTTKPITTKPVVTTISTEPGELPPGQSCAARGCNSYSADAVCQCDAECPDYGDCCTGE